MERILLICLVLTSAACSDAKTTNNSDVIDLNDMADTFAVDVDIASDDSTPVIGRCPGPEWAELDVKRADALSRSTTESVTELQLIGAAFGVASVNEKMVWSGAAGLANKESNDAWDTSRSFRIGSVSKTFTAAAIYTLIDEGVLSIDDSLDSLVPTVYDGNGVTIRHLLSHTSGIPSYNYVGNFDQTRSWTPDELVEWAETNAPEMLFGPNEKWEYSNTNYVLLGLVVEIVTSQPFEQFLEARFLCPLGLKNTYMANDADDTNVVQSYDADGNILFVDPSLGWTAGGMVSTPEDLAKWGAALFGGDLLSTASRSQMIAPVELPNDSSAAHGVFAEYGDDGLALFGHTGGIGGFQTYMYYWATEKVSLVAVTNRLEVNLRDLAIYGWREVIELPVAR